MPDVIYPITYPPPRIAPHEWEADMGLLRTPMAGGFARQRRLYAVQPHAWTLQFTIELTLLFEWQDWVSTNAYDFFRLPMVSWLSSQAGTHTRPTLVRFTSNLKISYYAVDSVVVDVTAEMSPADWSPAP
jgi:hypothetical protein